MITPVGLMGVILIFSFIINMKKTSQKNQINKKQKKEFKKKSN